MNLTLLRLHFMFVLSYANKTFFLRMLLIADIV